MQGVDPVLVEYAEGYGETMGDSLDQVQRDVIVAGTTICKSVARLWKQAVKTLTDFWESLQPVMVWQPEGSRC